MSDVLERWEGDSVHAWRDAWGVPLVEAYARIGSTNDRALELAAEGAGAFTVVIADEQTEGRGRRGARWHSAPGSGLWMSTVLPTARSTPWLPLLVGVAVAESIEEATGIPTVGLEWPNDLVIGSHGGPRKVGGILCESAGGAVVAGVGINLRAPPGGFPQEVARRATSLEVEGAKSLSVSHLVGLILGNVERRIGAGRARVDEEALAALRARDALEGRPVATDERGPGTARGIDADGALLLERADGSRVRVVSGSVRAV